MEQAESARRGTINCPVCNQEGQRIVCTSDNKSEIIFYHPKKIFRTVCRVVDAGTVNTTTIVNEEVEQHATDAA